MGRPGRSSFGDPQAEQAVQVADEKIGVFEEGQQREIAHHRQHQDPPSRPDVPLFQPGVHPAAQAVVHQDRKHHQQNIHRLAPAVQR